MATPHPANDDDLDEVTHQLLNGLTTVRGHAQLLHRRLRRPEPTQPEVLLATLGRIMDAADQLTHHIVTLRDGRRRPPPDSS